MTIAVYIAQVQPYIELTHINSVQILFIYIHIYEELRMCNEKHLPSTFQTRFTNTLILFIKDKIIHVHI